MGQQIVLAQHGDHALNRKTLMGMYRLRHEIFHDRLQWDVTSDNGMEHDEFDEGNPFYVLVKDDEDEVLGCWRLLPTMGPNMLRDVFPQLLHGKPAPQQPDVWELSRFAVATPVNEGTSQGFGFSDIPIEMMKMICKFAQHNGIRRFVSVTSVAVERMFRKLGVSVTRLGPPIKIGRVLAVVCMTEVDEITHFALFGTLPEDERLAA